jgi:class 3 adenylate cyclase/tetratricopeptide (TPR) repeat protein
MTCPSCGLAVPEGARFCPSCGQAMLASRGEERRVVTVLFADLVGFTSFAETMDPEQVKNLVDGCFELLVSDVTQFGGRVDKIVGDAIIALFGAPVAHEDDAERAVRAALRMQATVQAHARDRGVDIRMRVGVNTGEVLVGALRAGGDYTAMGDVVNVASRLQSGAPPGGVVVGASTHDATDQAIRYRALGPVEVRGREPVEAWLALEAMAPPGRRHRRARSPLVGRETETALLLDGIRLATRHGRPFLGVVEGEGGVGKNRLVEAVAREAASSVGALVLEGRCVPYGEPNPWYPLASALDDHLGIDGSASPEEARVAARTALAAIGGTTVEDPAIARDVEGLLHLAGFATPLDRIEPGRAREELARSLVNVLDALARSRPVVLVVADLQWADHLVLGALENLLARLSGLPFTLLTTLRPEREIAWPPVSGRQSSLVLRLDPLDRESADRLVRLLLGGDVAADVLDDLYERSGGNPFFLEELATLVVRSGDPTTELPGTLRGLVAARLDALPPEQRAMLENAAVLGSSGTWVGLARFAAALGQEAERSVLDDLADADLLDVAGGHWSFRSESVREVAYATLTKAARAQRHAGVAREYEQVFGDRADRAEQIAFHYAAAAELVRELGTVRGVPDDVQARAVAWLTRAAEYNLDQEVLATAVRLASQGLELLDGGDITDPVVQRLLLLRGESLQELHDIEAATSDAVTALEGAQRAGDRRCTARARTVLGEIERTAGRLDASARELALAAGLFEEVGDRAGLAEALRAWGMTSIYAGDFEAAERHLVEADELFEALGDRRGRAWVGQHRAWVSFVKGEVAEADRRLAAAAATFGEMGDRPGLAWVNGLLAFVRYHQGERDEAERLGVLVMAEAQERGDRWAESMMRSLLASLRLWAGRTDEALQLATEARNGFSTLGDRFGQAQAMAPLSRALVGHGHVGDAMRAVEECSAMAAHFGLEGFAATIDACAAYHAGLADRAVREGRHALEQIGAESGMGFDARVALGIGLLQVGRVEEALLELERAADLQPDSPHARGALALAVTAAGNPLDGVRLAEPVAIDPAATYLDRIVAASAAGLAHARLGDLGSARSALDTAVSLADASDDLVARALARWARAEGLTALTAPDASDATQAAEAASALVEGGVAGWARAFGTVAHDGLASPALEGSS